jgi:hypothetical protein
MLGRHLPVGLLVRLQPQQQQRMWLSRSPQSARRQLRLLPLLLLQQLQQLACRMKTGRSL